MPLNKLMAGLLLCLCVNTLFASNQAYKGVVKDDSGNPMEFVNVTLMALNDSILSPASFMLGEVVVKGSRPVAKVKGDGVQVAIAGSCLANTGTALEVLGKMPFVTKSGSDIEVLGKGSPLIYINGRQVRDMSELDQLSSSRIKSVDVVTNPGARYASTVNSVIRITTVAPQGDGFSFNDRTTVGYKHYAYLFEQLNLNWCKNGFDIFGMLNYENYRERPRFSNNTTQYLKSGIVQQDSHGQDFAKYPVYQGKLGLNYNSPSHCFGFYYDFSYKPSRISGTVVTDRYMDNVFTETLKGYSASRQRNRQHLVSAYYSGQLGKCELSANFDALWQINDKNNADTENSTVNPVRDFTTVSNVGNRLLAGNVTAAFPVWKGDLKFGTEVTGIHRTDRYSGNVDYITDSDVKISETTTALFAETEQPFGAISASLGLRWEYTDSKYWQSGQLSDDQSRKYHNLAPSASVSIPIGNVNTRFSYMRKTSRPAFEQLSSAVKYIDRYSYESGNPDLKPIYRDYVSASASWKDIVLELEYYSTKNYFMWQTSEYPGNDDITLLTMVNMPRFNTYGAYINYSPVVFGCWHTSIMAGINAQDFKITHNGKVMSLDKPLGIFRFDNAIHLPWDMWLNVDFSARTSGNGDNCYVKPYWQCNLGLHKSFANDAWSIKLQLNDVFDTWRHDITLYDAISYNSSKKIYDTRDLSLTIRCNFNSARTRYTGRGAGNADKSRFFSGE